MGYALKRDQTEFHSPQIRALRELEKFLESPHSIGIDSLKESLRNTVQLMLELKGYSTGYDLSHLVIGEHASLTMDGLSKEDMRKKRLKKQFWDDFMALQKDLNLCFQPLFEEVHVFITNIAESIEAKLDHIDAQIESFSESEEHAETLKEHSKKRQKLVKFQEHITDHKEELKDVETTEELVEIKKNLSLDLENFNKHVPLKAKHEPISDILKGAHKAAQHYAQKRAEQKEQREAFNQAKIPDDPFYDFMNDHEFAYRYSQSFQKHQYHTHSANDANLDESGSSDEGGDDTSGSGDQNQDVDPPVPQAA
ncbi:MAG: hypothetical protein ACRBDI_07740 [Alphaproteobacteria bacterium]